MQIFYSAASGGFYLSAIHSQIPDDAVEITAERHVELLDGQSQGLLIAPGPDGYPVLQEQEEAPVVPASVTRRQARQALHAAGLLSVVDDYFSQQPTDVRIDYEDAQTFDRHWPTLALAAAALGLSSEQLDALFIDAAGR
jgi:hypothetical protein